MTYAKGFWSGNWGKQQQRREYLCDWELAQLQTTQPAYLALLTQQKTARLAVTAQLVSGAQMPPRLIPEAAAKSSDLFESASKHLGLAGFTQSLFQPEMDRARGFALQFLCTNIAILCPGILDAGPEMNLAFSATFQAIALSRLWLFFHQKGSKICQLLPEHQQHADPFHRLSLCVARSLVDVAWRVLSGWLKMW